MPSVLVVGATRGLGYELAKKYAQSEFSVIGTARSGAPKGANHDIHWISGVDIAKEDAGKTIVDGLKGHKQDIVIITAGYFVKESLDDVSFEAEVNMYKICSIGPLFVVQALHKAGLLDKGGKVILVSSEAGSIALRHESEGGGMYGHHASKAALNMVGKLLSFDLKESSVAVAMVHPGFMRTDLTRGVGFDKFWDDGGAVTPDVAAKSLVEWIDAFDMSKTGEFWAPRGPGYVVFRKFDIMSKADVFRSDIGTAEPVLGPKEKLSTPLQLPW